MLLLAGGVVLATAGSSLGSAPCTQAIDADAVDTDGDPEFATPVEAGDALRTLVADAAAADLSGCTEFRVELAGTFALTDALFWTQTEPLVLAGPAAGDGGPARLEADDPQGAHRLVTAMPAPGATQPVGAVTIERLVLAGGEVEGRIGDDFGGAVLGDVVRLVDSELIGNSATIGGAVRAREVNAERTSFVTNVALGGASPGGAIFATETVTLVNVTFVGNVAAEGGAVWLPAAGTLDATFVTFLDNSTTASSAGADVHRSATGPGGGSGSGEVVLRGVLFGGVADGAQGPSCGGVALPAIGSGLTVDGSFATDDSCDGVTEVAAAALPLTFARVPFLAGTTDLHVLDGGPAALGEVACDAAAGWPAVDQRGVVRPQGTTCDAGAVERVASVPPEEPEEPEEPEAPANEPEPGDAGGHAGGDAGGGEGPAGPVVEGPVPTSVPAGDGACAVRCG